MRPATLLLAVVFAACDADAATTQDLRQRLRESGDETVVFQFDARDGVCGDGDVVVRTRAPEGRSVSFFTRNVDHTREQRDFDRLDTWCLPGPVRVQITREQSRIARVDLAVGGNPFTDARDLGEVPAAEAARVLIEDIARDASRNVAERALHAASLADAESWPLLLVLARDENVSEKIRRNARHLLALDASERLLAGQPAASEQTEIRRQAVFALSRREDEPSRNALWELAESGDDAPVRAAALYWLGLSSEPRGLDLLERVLRQGR